MVTLSPLQIVGRTLKMYSPLQIFARDNGKIISVADYRRSKMEKLPPLQIIDGKWKVISVADDIYAGKWKVISVADSSLEALSFNHRVYQNLASF